MSTTDAPARIAPAHLHAFAASVYERLGVPLEDAALVADSLVQADLWGHASHGVLRTFWYADRLERGSTVPVARPAWVADAGALAVLDGGDGLGQVAARMAMDGAVARAKAHGIGAVSVRNSGHFGTAMYFTRRAVRAGCIGFLSTNASPAMAPWGGRSKLVGTNPWSIAAPAGRHPPLMLDVANTAVARGKLYAAAARGEPVPFGWALDVDGAPTNDPLAGIAGTLLPMAGHKGYAIAVLMDVLSGVLSGSSFGAAVVGPYRADERAGVGHLALAIDVSAARPVGDFERDVERLIDELHADPSPPGADGVRVPGELEARSEALLAVEGVPVPPATLAALDAGAVRLGVPRLAEVARPAAGPAG